MHPSIIVILGGLAAVILLRPWLRQRRHVFEVPEGWAGLLYRHGLYVRRNNAGRRVVWGDGWSLKVVDLRKASLAVPVQEVLTADNVPVKAGLLVTYQMANPALALHETQDWLADLHSAAELALRTTASRLTVEAWLARQTDLGALLQAHVQSAAAKTGVQIHAVEVGQLTLPPELKQTFAQAVRNRRRDRAARETTDGGIAPRRSFAGAMGAGEMA